MTPRFITIRHSTIFLLVDLVFRERSRPGDMPQPLVRMSSGSKNGKVMMARSPQAPTVLQACIGNDRSRRDTRLTARSRREVDASTVS
jgi:hypothetical protein